MGDKNICENTSPNVLDLCSGHEAEMSIKTMKKKKSQ